MSGMHERAKSSDAALSEQAITRKPQVRRVLRVHLAVVGVVVDEEDERVVRRHDVSQSVRATQAVMRVWESAARRWSIPLSRGRSRCTGEKSGDRRTSGAFRGRVPRTAPIAVVASPIDIRSSFAAPDRDVGFDGGVLPLGGHDRSPRRLTRRRTSLQSARPGDACLTASTYPCGDARVTPCSRTASDHQTDSTL